MASIFISFSRGTATSISTYESACSSRFRHFKNWISKYPPRATIPDVRAKTRAIIKSQRNNCSKLGIVDKSRESIWVYDSTVDRENFPFTHRTINFALRSSMINHSISQRKDLETGFFYQRLI